MVKGEEARLQGNPRDGVVAAAPPDACKVAPLHLSPNPAGKPSNRESECSVPSASSARCASSSTNWNLLPPPHCRAERSQAPLPRPSPGPPLTRASVAPAPGAGPSPHPLPGRAGEGRRSARWGLTRLPPAGGARPRARRRVGAAPAAPAHAGHPWPPLGQATAPWRPRGRCHR